MRALAVTAPGEHLGRSAKGAAASAALLIDWEPQQMRPAPSRPALVRGIECGLELWVHPAKLIDHACGPIEVVALAVE